MQKITKLRIHSDDPPDRRRTRVREGDKLRLEVEVFFSGEAFVAKQLKAGKWTHEELLFFHLLLQKKELAFRLASQKVATASQCLQDRISGSHGSSLKELQDAFEVVGEGVATGFWTVEELRQLRSLLGGITERFLSAGPFL